MQLGEIGFSLWCDFLERDFLEGEFTELISKGIIKGATSNPAIFQSSFTTSAAYKESIAELKGHSPKQIYEALAIADITRAADLLMPLHMENPEDGWVSIEVDPFLCTDSMGTISEGVRLYGAIARPNVMIKIPATEAGYGAMETLIARGISVNATLVFSPKQAQKCLEAFARGYNKGEYAEAERPQAVISIFVSRLDRKYDKSLQELGIAPSLLGIRNAQRIYRQIEAVRVKGVRALFASTGVKGDALAPSYYVDSLLHAHSINTAPLHTIRAFVNAGSRTQSAIPSFEEEVSFFEEIERVGIDLELGFDELLAEGIILFKESFQSLLHTLEA